LQAPTKKWPTAPLINAKVHTVRIEIWSLGEAGQKCTVNAAEKRIEYDEKELRHRVRRRTRQKLDELMAWNDIEE
jgi:hypothetical protein